MLQMLQFSFGRAYWYFCVFVESVRARDKIRSTSTCTWNATLQFLAFVTFWWGHSGADTVLSVLPVTSGALSAQWPKVNRVYPSTVKSKRKSLCQQIYRWPLSMFLSVRIWIRIWYYITKAIYKHTRRAKVQFSCHNPLREKKNSVLMCINHSIIFSPFLWSIFKDVIIKCSLFEWFKRCRTNLNWTVHRTYFYVLW